MYESPPAVSMNPSSISQMPPKLSATTKSMTAIPPLRPKVTCSGEAHSIMHSPMNTSRVTIVDDITCPMSPHQLMSR